MPWEKLFGQINVPADTSNLTDLEKKHLPIITAPDEISEGQCFDVVIEVGKLLTHPNEHGHFIEFVDLYADHVFLARADLSAQTTCPTVKFCVSLPGPTQELRAYERCNLHGIWMAAKPIRVSQ